MNLYWHKESLLKILFPPRSNNHLVRRSWSCHIIGHIIILIITSSFPSSTSCANLVRRNYEVGLDLVLLEIRVPVSSVAVFYLMTRDHHHHHHHHQRHHHRHHHHHHYSHLIVSVEVHQGLRSDVDPAWEAGALHDVGQRHVVRPARCLHHDRRDHRDNGDHCDWLCHIVGSAVSIVIQPLI